MENRGSAHSIRPVSQHLNIWSGFTTGNRGSAHSARFHNELLPIMIDICIWLSTKGEGVGITLLVYGFTLGYCLDLGFRNSNLDLVCMFCLMFSECSLGLNVSSLVSTPGFVLFP